MKKLWAVFKREYIQTVRKKSFIILTILAPFLMAGLMLFPALIASRGFGEKKVAVLDATGRLREAIEGAERSAGARSTGPARKSSSLKRDRRDEIPLKIRTQYVSIEGIDARESVKPYIARLNGDDKERALDGVFVIPADAFADRALKLTYYSRSSTDLIGQERLGRIVNRALARSRLEDKGLDPAEVDGLLEELSVDAIQVSKSGAETKGGRMNFFVGLVFVMLILIPVAIYGQEIMRGIIQEKTERIVEILVSSMSPMELLSGKILGMAAVGLTQIAVWMAMASLLAVFSTAMMSASGANIGQFLRPAVAAYFLIFFILAYLIYVCVYAVAGAIVNSEKEAQQVVAPVILLLMAPWFLIMPIIMNPDSTMATVLSLIPVYTPITMFVRVLVSEPPFWQVLLSITLSIVTIVGMLWVTAKIFRLGLLSYGKRPTIPELWRWLKVA